MKGLTHFDETGRPRMVDVSGKPDTARSATARGRVRFTPDAYNTIRRGEVKKGDVRAVAELAGVMGAKQTSALIPLCHPLQITSVNVKASFNDADHSLAVLATVKTMGPTGVEMEALTAAAAACLTIYDMTKAIDKEMTIEGIELVEKTGGASGDYHRS